MVLVLVWVLARSGCLVLLGLGIASSGTVVAQPTAARRSPPPVWDDTARQIFFADAFREGLRGERPARRVSLEDNASRPAANSSAPLDRAEDDAATWSDTISAASIEDEIKAIRLLLGQALASEGEFKNQVQRELRVHLATATLLWAIIDQYDGQVRWQADARAALDRFARLTRNAKAASTQVYREAMARGQDLEDLIRGAQLSVEPNDTPWSWADVVDRSLLMRRLELSVDQRLAEGLTDRASSSPLRDRTLREGELVAAIARAMLQPDMPDAEDAEYRQWSDQLERAARQLHQALQDDDLSTARQAHAQVKQSCVACHEVYR